MEIYKVDILNGNLIMGIYNLILDTTKLDMKSVIDITINAIENYKKCNPEV
jgi:cytidylate kinase